MARSHQLKVSKAELSLPEEKEIPSVELQLSAHAQCSDSRHYGFQTCFTRPYNSISKKSLNIYLMLVLLLSLNPN